MKYIKLFEQFVNKAVQESTEILDIVKDLDRVKNDLIKRVDILIAKKKKLYSNVDIESPMSTDEKKLDKDISDIFSEIQQLILQKRKIKNESFINESEDTYNDYPEAAKKNAQLAIDWKEKYGRDEVEAGTAVGWARAHQLAKGENLSADTVKRMASFNRHRKNSTIATEFKDTPWKDRGHVAFLIWGGDEGVDWAMKKSKEINGIDKPK